MKREYQKLEDVMNDVKLLINNFIQKSEELVNNEIFEIKELIDKSIKNINNDFYSVNDAVCYLKENVNEIELRKEAIKINILNLAENLEKSLININRNELRNKKQLEIPLNQRNWFYKIIKSKDSDPEYVKSKVRLEQLGKFMPGSKCDLIMEIEQSLQFLKIKNNIMETSKSLECINNLSNISKVDSKLEQISFFELLELKNSLRDETKLLLNTIKQDIHKVGQKWKDDLFKVKDLKLNGDLKNDEQLYYLNQQNFMLELTKSTNTISTKISNLIENIKKPDFNVLNFIAKLSLVSVLTATIGGGGYLYGESQLHNKIDNYTNIISNNSNVEKIINFDKEYNIQKLLSSSSFKNGKADIAIEISLENLKTFSDYFISGIGNIDIANKAFLNINQHEILEVGKLSLSKNENKTLFLSPKNNYINNNFNNIIYTKKKDEIDII